MHATYVPRTSHALMSIITFVYLSVLLLLPAVNGTCPQSFDLLSTGVVLSAPTKSCDFSLVLGDEPDFFVTSQAGAACQNNLKMNIHSVCPQKTGVAAGSVLSMNSAGSLGSSAGGWSTGIVPGSRFTQTESMQSPLAAAQNAYSSTAMGQQQEGLQEAGAAQNAAARSAASLLGLAAVTVAVRVAVLL